MTTHCKTGDKNSIVSYRFNNQTEKVVKIKNAPIDVTTKTVGDSNDFSGGQCPDLYYVYYRAIANDGTVGQEQATTVLGAITKIQVDILPARFDSFSTSWNLWVTCAGGSNYENGIAKIFIIYTVYGRGEFLRIEPVPPNLDNCGNNDSKKCEISVSYQNNLIFKDTGKCPVTYEVVCDSDCPTGTVKCKSTNYPGYCCLPCSEIKNQIKAIASQVRSLTNG